MADPSSGGGLSYQINHFFYADSGRVIEKWEFSDGTAQFSDTGLGTLCADGTASASAADLASACQAYQPAPQQPPPLPPTTPTPLSNSVSILGVVYGQQPVAVQQMSQAQQQQQQNARTPNQASQQMFFLLAGGLLLVMMVKR